MFLELMIMEYVYRVSVSVKFLFLFSCLTMEQMALFLLKPKSGGYTQKYLH